MTRERKRHKSALNLLAGWHRGKFRGFAEQNAETFF